MPYWADATRMRSSAGAATGGRDRRTALLSVVSRFFFIATPNTRRFDPPLANFACGKNRLGARFAIAAVPVI
jgi:hypothetical protein